MRKQALLIAVLLLGTFLLIGCNGQEQEQPKDEQVMMEEENVDPVGEEAAESISNTESQEVRNIIQDIEAERINKEQLQEEEEAAENEQIQKDLQLLDSFNGEPKKSDCEKITHADVKVACLELIEE